MKPILLYLSLLLFSLNFYVSAHIDPMSILEGDSLFIYSIQDDSEDNKDNTIPLEKSEEDLEEDVEEKEDDQKDKLHFIDSFTPSSFCYFLRAYNQKLFTSSTLLNGFHSDIPFYILFQNIKISFPIKY